MFHCVKQNVKRYEAQSSHHVIGASRPYQIRLDQASAGFQWHIDSEANFWLMTSLSFGASSHWFFHWKSPVCGFWSHFSEKFSDWKLRSYNAHIRISDLVTGMSKSDWAKIPVTSAKQRDFRRLPNLPPLVLKLSKLGKLTTFHRQTPDLWLQILSLALSMSLGMWRAQRFSEDRWDSSPELSWTLVRRIMCSKPRVQSAECPR